MSDDATSWPPGARPEVFCDNLAALVRRQPALAERLCLPVAGDHVTRDGEGRLRYRFRGAELPLEVAAEEAEARVERALGTGGAPDAAPGGATDAPGPLLVLGVGAGELAERALARGARVVVWDRDPWMFRLWLGRRDLSCELRERRLELALGTDLLAPRLARLARVEHPLLARAYALELETLARGAGRPKALVCAGGLLVESLARALAARGYASWTLDAERLAREELLHTAAALRPALVLSVNHRSGLPELADEVDAPLLVWEIDPATDLPERPARGAESTRVFTYRRAHVPLFRAAGFPYVEPLPLAADTELRRPVELTHEERAHYAAPVSFVGSSLVANAERLGAELLAALARWTGDAADADRVLAAVLAEQRADPTHWRGPELLEAHAPGFAAAHAGARVRPEALLGELCASERRLAVVGALADRGVQVWGDAGWERLAARGVRWRGPASHARDVTRVYGASTVNLDVGRLYQTDIVTLRVFDVLACGGLALVEHSPELEELFEVGVELESWRDPGDLRSKLDRLLTHPDEARRTAARGRAAVLERHALDARVARMLASLPPAALPASRPAASGSIGALP